MIKFGDLVREQRLKKGLSLDDVVKETKIRQAFLTAIEKGDYNRLPSFVHAQGFVKNYIEFLGLPKNKSLALFRREFDDEKQISVLPKSLSEKEFIPRQKNIGNILLIVLSCIVLLVYIFFQYRYAIFNPFLNVYSPSSMAKIHSVDVVVKGKTDPSVTLYINNNVISINNKGYFSQTIVLFPGEQQIVVQAVNSFGRQTIIKRTVYVLGN